MMKILNTLLYSYFFFSSIFLFNSSLLKSVKQFNEFSGNSHSARFRDVLFSLMSKTFFNSIDTNHDGSITANEFTNFSISVHAKRGLPVPNEEDIKSSFAKINSDQNGRVNLNQFSSWFRSESVKGGTDGNMIFDLASHVTFDKLDMHHNNELTGTQFVEGIQDFARKNELGNINESALRGVYYNALNPGDNSFKVRHFERLARKEIIDSVVQEKVEAKAQAIAKTWQMASINEIIGDMLVYNLFNSIDSERNAKISMNEFIIFYKQFSYSHGWDTPVTLDIQYLFNLIDLDRSGTVTIGELNAYFRKSISNGQNFKLFAKIASTISFERLDKDKSGGLTQEEFRNGLNEYANSRALQSPELYLIKEAWNSVIHSERTLNINDFHLLVSNLSLGRDHIIAGSNQSSQERLRGILSSLLIETLFKQIDKRKKGTISFDEFADYAKKLTVSEGSYVPSDESLKRSFAKVDQDHSGTITKTEFRNFLNELLKSGQSLGIFVELAAATTFRSLNFKNNGDLSIEEYRLIINNHAAQYGINAPSHEAINASWRHAIGSRDKFSSETFLHLIGSQFGLDVSVNTEKSLT